MKNYLNRNFILFLIALIGLGQLASDLYLPSLPAMGHDLAASVALLQLTIACYFLTYSFSQLIYGPLSDNLGRVFVLRLGLSIFLIGSLFCVLSQSIYLLLIGRAIQGLGIGSAAVCCRAMSRDVFSGKDLVKVLSFIGMATAIIPAVAPVFGGLIQQTMGWRANFILLSSMGACLLIIVSFYLAETNRFLSPFLIKNTLKNFSELATNTAFQRNTLCIVFSLGGIIAFNTAAPFLLQQAFGLSPFYYGICILFVAGSYFIGNIVIQFLIKKMSAKKCILLGILINLFAASLFLFLSLFAKASILGIVLPFCIYAIGTGLIMPAASTEALSPFRDKAGIAGALMGFSINLGSALVSALIASCSINTSPLPLAFIMVLLTIAMFLFFVTKPISQSKVLFKLLLQRS